MKKVLKEFLPRRDGVYQAGARGWNWIKFKRSYSSKIDDTIDCLVMGYDWERKKNWFWNWCFSCRITTIRAINF